jgi:16S rRNA processing protein RimM
VARASRLQIGKIGPPHGLRGDVHATLHFAESDALAPGVHAWVLGNGAPRELVVRSAQSHGRGILLGFEGVDDRDAALGLRGARLELERSALPPLAAGEYYLVDLIGATVIGPDGPLGEVTGIETHPSVTSLTLRLTDGRVVEQPLSAPWVKHVDADAGRIELESLDGLVI